MAGCGLSILGWKKWFSWQKLGAVFRWEKFRTAPYKSWRVRVWREWACACACIWHARTRGGLCERVVQKVEVLRLFHTY